MNKKKATLGDNLPKLFVLSFFGVGVLALLYNAVWPKQNPALAQASNQIAVVQPPLSADGVAGKDLFEKNCATCHGENATGTDQGPPFINRIYNPGHHGDRSFYSAARNGVRQHHWTFGNMPAQPQVSNSDVTRIIAYIRELQAANGIKYETHNM